MVFFCLFGSDSEGSFILCIFPVLGFVEAQFSALGQNSRIANQQANVTLSYVLVIFERPFMDSMLPVLGCVEG